MSKKMPITSDIRHVREELALTAPVIAVSLAMRPGNRKVMLDVADDLLLAFIAEWHELDRYV
jgi:hypothetical protein